MREIPLTRGYVALVDDEDYKRVVHMRWHARPSGRVVYAHRYKAKGRRGALMHRVILDAAPGAEVDHIDGNGLNNQRANLRQCSRAENTRNTTLRRSNTTGFKGIWFDRGKFVAGLTADGRALYLGRHDTPEAAALAYDVAARRHHGEFARLNFPMPGERGALPV